MIPILGVSWVIIDPEVILNDKTGGRFSHLFEALKNRRKAQRIGRLTTRIGQVFRQKQAKALVESRRDDLIDLVETNIEFFAFIQAKNLIRRSLQSEEEKEKQLRFRKAARFLTQRFIFLGYLNRITSARAAYWVSVQSVARRLLAKRKVALLAMEARTRRETIEALKMRREARRTSKTQKRHIAKTAKFAIKVQSVARTYLHQRSLRAKNQALHEVAPSIVGLQSLCRKLLIRKSIERRLENLHLARLVQTDFIARDNTYQKILMEEKRRAEEKKITLLNKKKRLEKEHESLNSLHWPGHGRSVSEAMNRYKFAVGLNGVSFDHPVKRVLNHVFASNLFKREGGAILVKRSFFETLNGEDQESLKNCWGSLTQGQLFSATGLTPKHPLIKVAAPEKMTRGALYTILHGDQEPPIEYVVELFDPKAWRGTDIFIWLGPSSEVNIPAVFKNNAEAPFNLEVAQKFPTLTEITKLEELGISFLDEIKESLKVDCSVDLKLENPTQLERQEPITAESQVKVAPGLTDAEMNELDEMIFSELNQTGPSVESESAGNLAMGTWGGYGTQSSSQGQDVANSSQGHWFGADLPEFTFVPVVCVECGSESTRQYPCRIRKNGKMMCGDCATRVLQEENRRRQLALNPVPGVPTVKCTCFIPRKFCEKHRHTSILRQGVCSNCEKMPARK